MREFRGVGIHKWSRWAMARLAVDAALAGNSYCDSEGSNELTLSVCLCAHFVCA